MAAIFSVLITKVIVSIAVAMSAYHLYTGYFGAPEALLHRSIHLLFTLVLIFFLFPFSKKEWGEKFRWTDGLLILLTLACIGYLFFNYEYVVTRYPYVHPLSVADMVFGIILTLLLMEGSRRVIGPALPITAGVFLIYAYVGPYLPGLLRHTGFTTEAIVDQLYMTTEGIFGIPLGVSATYVILFIIFGTFLEKSGTGQLFMDFASAITGWTRGGPGKISCISSALFGTISGSAVANVMVDGWLTIPLMKRTGFKPPFACAVEATASTGGQIMPPVMGAAAFVMAEFLGIPYITICLYAMIPALLYYFALFMSIHFMAGRMGLKGIPREELPRLKKVLAARGHMFIPLGIIVYMMTAGYTPMYACIYSTVAVIVLSFLRKETRMGFWTIIKRFGRGCQKHTGCGRGLCLCWHRHRGDQPHRVGLEVHQLCPLPRRGIAHPSPDHDDAGRNRPGDGHAHHSGLYRSGSFAHSCPDQARGHEYGGSYVCLLFLHHLGHHAARGHGRLCSRRYWRSKIMAHGHLGRAYRGSRVHRSFYVRLWPIPALHRLGLRHHHLC